MGHGWTFPNLKLDPDKKNMKFLNQLYVGDAVLKILYFAIL